MSQAAIVLISLFGGSLLICVIAFTVDWLSWRGDRQQATRGRMEARLRQRMERDYQKMVAERAERDMLLSASLSVKEQPICPKCDKRPINPPDYLCKECRGH